MILKSMAICLKIIFQCIGKLMTQSVKIIFKSEKKGFLLNSFPCFMFNRQWVFFFL